jgi:hypothetical protein
MASDEGLATRIRDASVQDEPGVRPFDLTGRPMTGWLLVAANGHAEDDDLRRWVNRGVGYAASLPPKAP